MIEFLRTIALLVSVYGGHLDCRPVDPPFCTLFVDSYTALDIYQDPWGNTGLYRWSPVAYVIGGQGEPHRIDWVK